MVADLSLASGVLRIPVTHPTPETLREEDLPLPFGRFTLTGLLGQGGMGRVFRAVMQGPSGFRKDVALKVISGGHPGAIAETQEGLGKEARIGALLKHPNIVDIYDFGDDGGLPWISMELVHGLDLQALMAETRLSPRHVVELGMAIAAGLDHAHTLQIDEKPAGLVHRDLKPSNVLISRDGIVKVMDFGIAKLMSEGSRTETGVAKGTPAFMSPEQASAEEIDGRSDLWSLGAILYQLATGEPLLQGRTVIELMMQLLQLPQRLEDPNVLAAVNQHVPGLSPIVEHLLQSDPNARYAHASTVEKDLAELLPALSTGPSLRAVVRDVLSGGDGLQLVALSTRPVLGRLGLSATLDWPTPTNIPADSTSFLGRASDMETISEHFTQRRLVTLLGMGGSGKTRLAGEFGRSHLDRWPQGGAWFIPLDRARDLDGVLHAVGRVLEIPLQEESPEEKVNQIGAGLAARGGLLLILDNFEQVVSLAPQTVNRWLQAAPKLHILVTSRELLRVEGEQVHPVGPLSTAAAAQLFIDRGRGARASFSPTDEDATIIEEIVTRLDAIPLAVELAASRVAVLPPKKLLARLSQRFRLLRSGTRGTSDRRATLEGAIGWSWDLLAAPEQWTLAWCSTFRGGFTLEQAEELIDLSHFDETPWVLDTVEALRDKSLLRTSEGSTGDLRFGMFESIREFAAARLQTFDPQNDARDKHAQMLCRFGEEIVHEMRGTDATEGHARLAEELDNFVVAYEHTSTTGDWTTSAGLVVGITPTLFRRGPGEYLARITDQVNEHSDELAPRLRAKTKHALALSQRRRGQRRKSAESGWESVRIAEDAGDELLAATHAPTLGYAVHDAKSAEIVVGRLREAQAFAKTRGDKSLEGLLLSSLAVALGYTGDAKASERCTYEALELHRASGNRFMAAVAAGNIAVWHAERGELEEAEQWVLESYEGLKDSNDLTYKNTTLGNLAAIYLELDQLPSGARALRRALALARKMGMLPLLPIFVSNMGQLSLLQKDYEQAEALFLEAAEIYANGVDPDPYHVGVHCTFWGVRDLLSGDPEKGRERLEAAVSQYQMVHSSRDVGICQGLLGVAYATCGDEESALRALHEGRSLADKLDSDDIRFIVGLAEGHVELLRATQARASGHLKDALVLEGLAADRLETFRFETVRPSLVRLARRLLELAVGHETTL